MGSGAAKNVSAIPIYFAVNIYAAEGLLHVAETTLGKVIKAALEGDETASTHIQPARESVERYSRQYTNAIRALEYYLSKI